MRDSMCMVCDNGLDQWTIEAGLPSLRYDIDETVHIREECILFQQKDTQFNAVSNKGRVNVAKQLEIELYWLNLNLNFVFRHIYANCG